MAAIALAADPVERRFVHVSRVTLRDDAGDVVGHTSVCCERTDPRCDIRITVPCLGERKLD